jgi:hypothetical protein
MLGSSVVIVQTAEGGTGEVLTSIREFAKVVDNGKGYLSKLLVRTSAH